MNYIVEITELEKKVLFYITTVLAGENWEKKGDIYRANVTLTLATSELEALKRISGKLTRKNPSLFSLKDLFTPGKKAGGVVE